MDTEKYEEAVRDYEHVFKTNKTRGMFNNTIQYNTISFILRRIHQIVNISSFELVTDSHSRYRGHESGWTYRKTSIGFCGHYMLDKPVLN